jgi:hypothetical protein
MIAFGKKVERPDYTFGGKVTGLSNIGPGSKAGNRSSSKGKTHHHQAMPSNVIPPSPLEHSASSRM